MLVRADGAGERLSSQHPAKATLLVHAVSNIYSPSKSSRDVPEASFRTAGRGLGNVLAVRPVIAAVSPDSSRPTRRSYTLLQNSFRE